MCRKMIAVVALGSWHLLAACGASIDRDVSDRVTISQGVFGQTTRHDDVGSNPVEYHQMDLVVFAAPRAQGVEPVARVTSGERGFYEVELAAGDFEICTTFDRCAQFSIGEGERARLDYEFGAGPGWSVWRDG